MMQEVRGDEWRCVEMRGDAWRCVEMRGGAGRCGRWRTCQMVTQFQTLH